MSTTYELDGFSSKVQVTLPPGLARDEVEKFKPFNDWVIAMRKSLELQSDPLHHFHAPKERYTLRSIDVRRPERFGKRIGFLMLDTVVQNADGSSVLPGKVFLRGGSVAILIVLSPTNNPDEKWVVMTQQPRIPVGSMKFWEIPAGMMDDEGEFVGAAARELKEETGLTVEHKYLKNLTAIALEEATDVEDHLQDAMYPSPGGCDEYIALFLWERSVTPGELADLSGKLTGVEREKIKVKLVRYQDLWREGARDAKTLGARALYESIKEYQPERLR